MGRYLEGFLVTGDAVYAFNPVYGQGMTVTAMASLALAQSLKRQCKQASDPIVTGLAREFQAKLAGVIALPWQMATNLDTMWPLCEDGTQSDWMTERINRVLNGYLTKVIHRLPYSTVVANAFFHVQNMLKPPTTLFHPTVVWHVLKPSAHGQPHSATVNRPAEWQGQTTQRVI